MSDDAHDYDPRRGPHPLEVWTRDEFIKWMRSQGVPEPPETPRVNTGMWKRVLRWFIQYEEPVQLGLSNEKGWMDK